MRPAREARSASLALGRRFLQFVNTIAPFPSMPAYDGFHFVTAFGYVCGVLGFEPEPSVLAYLQQSMTTLVSACQRLMPLGQSRAGRILWDLKPSIIATERRSRDFTVDTVASFTALPDMAAMRHPSLEPRLFIS
jgi:urease accessory protein